MTKRCRLKLGERDTLVVTLHPGYIHFQLTAPGKQNFIQDFYIPRSKLFPLVKWVVKSATEIKRRKDHYLPDAEARYLEQLAIHDQELRRQKREARKVAEKQARYLNAKRRAREKQRRT